MEVEMIYFAIAIGVIVLIVGGIILYDKIIRCREEEYDDYEDEDDEKEEKVEELYIPQVRNITSVIYNGERYRPYADDQGIWILSWLDGELDYQLIPKNVIKKVIDEIKKEEKEDK